MTENITFAQRVASKYIIVYGPGIARPSHGKNPLVPVLFLFHGGFVVYDKFSVSTLSFRMTRA